MKMNFAYINENGEGRVMSKYYKLNLINGLLVQLICIYQNV